MRSIKGLASGVTFEISRGSKRPLPYTYSKKRLKTTGSSSGSVAEFCSDSKNEPQNIFWKYGTREQRRFLWTYERVFPGPRKISTM
jgi:hypothetical protein